MGTVSPCITEAKPSTVGGSWGVAHMGMDTRGATTKCRDRDSQIFGIIRPVTSQLPSPHDVEGIRELDVEFVGRMKRLNNGHMSGETQ